MLLSWLVAMMVVWGMGKRTAGNKMMHISLLLLFEKKKKQLYFVPGDWSISKPKEGKILAKCKLDQKHAMRQCR
jgi:hypothetical protein